MEKRNKYVGLRYVPKVLGEWDKTQSYEPLCVVTYQGNSFTSKTFIPSNTDITNETFWCQTGNYNAQVELLKDNFDKNVNSLNENYSNFEKTVNDTIANYFKKVNETVENDKNRTNTIFNENKAYFLPYFGIKEGSENAQTNSNILKTTNFPLGATLILPIGDYYFSETIDLYKNQLSLKGYQTTFSQDNAECGCTTLHFENLLDGQSAIKLATGSLSNVKVKGNINNYSYKIDRTKTYVDKINIEKEIFINKTIGLSGGAITNIQNVVVENFYYGAKLDSGNIYINNFFSNSCHIGLSIGSDTKCVGVFGWYVHTLLEIRNSSSSAIQVRGDSVHHLVSLVGYSSGIYLSDLDGDYCLGSLVTVGVKDVYGSVEDLIINGLRGRCCVLHAYDTTKDNKPSTTDISNENIVDEWAMISVNNKNSIKGAKISISGINSSNPLDVQSNYLLPSIIIAGGMQTFINGVILELPSSTKNDLIIDRKNLLNYIYNFSQNANSTNINIITSRGIYFYNKQNPSTIITTQVTTSDLS